MAKKQKRISAKTNGLLGRIFNFMIEFVNILDVDEELIEQVRNWRNSESVSKFMYTNHHISKEEHNSWIDKLKTENTAKAWIIKYDDKPIGLASLSDIDFENKTTDWGFYIADENLRGKGLGSVTLDKLMKIVFDDMKFFEMKTRVLNNNKTAINLYEKMGFKKVGSTDEKIIRDDESIEIIIMSIKSNEWRKT